MTIVGGTDAIAITTNSIENTNLGLEDLKKEFLVQEKLIAAYQKENARLTKVLKDQEIEVATKQAQFYDKQEALNRELNRLRNSLTPLHDIDLKAKKKTSDLATELEQDGKIRYLQEKISDLEAQMITREKGFISSINKYKLEIAELNNIIQHAKSLHPHHFEIELENRLQEIDQLKNQLSKLRDYKLRFEDVGTKLLLKEQSLNVVKRELLGCGVSLDLIEQFLSGAVSMTVVLSRVSDSVLTKLRTQKESREAQKIKSVIFCPCRVIH